MPGDRAPDHRVFEQPWPEGEYRFFQLGFVVDDLISAAERWTRVFGIGPFHVMPRRERPCTFRNEPSTMDLQVAVAQAGPVQIELIREYSGGAGLFEAFTGVRAGLHQLCTLTFDFGATAAHYHELGYQLVCELGGEPRVAFFDTLDDFGFYTEVVEATPTFVAAVAGIAETCSTWDGTDPVRILTRGGYEVP